MFHFSGCRVHNPMYSGYDNTLLKVLGYPIRIPPGLSSLAALRGFSQLVASFFACWHQGIHHKPLSSSFTRMRSTPGDSLNFEIFKRILLCMLDSCVSLFLEIVVSHKIVGVLIFSSESVILPRGCQSALLSDVLFTCLRGGYTADRT